MRPAIHTAIICSIGEYLEKEVGLSFLESSRHAEKIFDRVEPFLKGNMNKKLPKGTRIKLENDEAIQLIDDILDFDDNMEITVLFPDMGGNVTEKWHKSRVIGELYASEQIILTNNRLEVKSNYTIYGYVYFPTDGLYEYLLEKDNSDECIELELRNGMYHKV